MQVQTQALEFNNGDEEAKLMDRCLNCGTRGLRDLPLRQRLLNRCSFLSVRVVLLAFVGFAFSRLLSGVHFDLFAEIATLDRFGGFQSVLVLVVVLTLV